MRRLLLNPGLIVNQIATGSINTNDKRTPNTGPCLRKTRGAKRKSSDKDEKKSEHKKIFPSETDLFNLISLKKAKERIASTRLLHRLGGKGI